MATAVRREAAQRLKASERLGGKYLLVRRIAVGGMGEIWIARNEMTDAQVALKVLRGDVDTKVEVEPRFRHEARLGAMLAHRNIVRIFDLVEEADGALVLVMELLRGETLRHYLKAKGPIDAKEAAALMLPILSALEHAHEMGIVHRDLKPANIYLAVDPDGHVTPKLLDFGIAKLPMAGVQTLDGRVLGTPRYMSPEQIRSEPNIDGRSDLFSVGVLLVEMLTGQSPFYAKTPSASLAAVLEQQVDPDPRIDPKLWLVIQRALAKRPYERFATAAEFAKALREAVPVSDEELAAKLRRAKPASPRTTGANNAVVAQSLAPPTFGSGGGGLMSSSDDSDEDDDDDPGSQAAVDIGPGGAGASGPSPALDASGAPSGARRAVSRVDAGMAYDASGDDAGRASNDGGPGTAAHLAAVPGLGKRSSTKNAILAVAIGATVVMVIGAATIWRTSSDRTRAHATGSSTTTVATATTGAPSIPDPPAADSTVMELPANTGAAVATNTAAPTRTIRPGSKRTGAPRATATPPPPPPATTTAPTSKGPKPVATTPGF